MGYQVTVFDETREKSPLQIELGASYKLENVPIIWHLSIGAEIFTEGAFNGMDIESADFGLKMNRLKFNYDFLKYHPASNTKTFSLQINLN